MLSRRLFTTSIAAVPLSMSYGCQQKVVQGSQKISKIGLQTYTLREMFAVDPMKTFQMIKDVGYDFVEINSLVYGVIEPSELKVMLDDIGLEVPASHISIELASGDRKDLFSLATDLDLKYAVIPWIAEDARKLEDWRAHARTLDQAGKELADIGVRLAYHNHQFEFEDLGGGTTAMDILLNECQPENMDFEIDFFWAVLGQADIPALFKSNPGRFKMCHIKDMGPNVKDFADSSYEDISTGLMKNVGEGIIPFESFFALNDISGMEYFIAEHDNPPAKHRDSIATSYEAIKAFRF
jgi:sugar phosphate isomerase/epimerase